MGKIGYKKPAHSSKKGEVTHKFVDGPAYEIDNPVQKLLHVIGTFFSEPTYYAGGSNKNNPASVTDQALEVINAAHAVATSQTPEDLLVIAAWARDAREGLKLRTTPQVLFAVAASHTETRNLLPKYATKVMSRADDIRTAFAAYNALFVNTPKRTLPSSLKKSFALALAKQSAYGLVKYNSDDHPTFRDVIAMVKGDRNKSVVKDEKEGYPLSKGLYEYLCFGKVSDNSPDIVLKRSKFFKNKDLSTVTLKDVEEAGLTWENILSHFGNTPEVWKLCLPVMGEMALTRNFRNFEQANFDSKDWDQIDSALLPFDVVNGVVQPRKTVQLPFRFLSAYRHVTTGRAQTVIAKAFDRSILSIPELPGKSVSFTDNSGSMDSKVSEKSEVTLKDAGNALGAILAKRNNDGCDVYTFGDYVKRVELNTMDSGITLLKRITLIGQTTGCGTNIDDVAKNIDNYTTKGIKVDRFIILSDMCCYHYYASRGSLQRSFDEYRRKVNKNCFLYSCNLAGYSQAQVKPEDGNVIIMSGWSENIFKLMLDVENTVLGRNEKTNTILPTIEELRLKYKAN